MLTLRKNLNMRSKICQFVLDRRKYSGGAPVPTSEIVVDLQNKRSPLILSFGKLARLSDGSCVASSGSTSVLVTAMSRSTQLQTVQNFVPLTVDYRQKSAAAGRIPTNFLRRELGPTDREILTGRVIDRSIRPLFPKGYGCETQIVANLLAVDGIHDPDILALNATSAALSFSDIPWDGPVGGVRVGCVNRTELVINPRRRDMADSCLNLVVAGTRSRMAVMLESESDDLDKGLFVDAVEAGLEACEKIAKAIHSAAMLKGKAKRKWARPTLPATSDPADIAEQVAFLCEQPLRAVYSDRGHDKMSRDRAAFALRDKAVAELTGDSGSVHEAFNKLSRRIVADMAIDEGLRVDGRGLDDLRDIGCEVDLHKPLHGSALFQRGQTQVMCTVALDSPESALKSDPISVLTGGVKEKNFFLHYEFPSYAAGDLGRSSLRRELGHGALAEKALRPVIPSNHPFTIRLTSEVLESNGSSSMASVCAGSMALMDAGVSVSRPAAGVAVGLFSRNNSVDPDTGEFTLGDRAVLLDILGMEDYIGDMDFKVAGTRTGITALQADIKLPGIPFEVVKQAMDQGHAGINRIIDLMDAAIAEPRASKSNWPVSEKFTVPIAKRGKFLGVGGINVKRLLSETGVTATADPVDAGSWTLFAPNSEAMAEANEFVSEVLADKGQPELVFGTIYSVRIVEIVDRGVYVELHPDLQPALVSNSQLDARKISHPSALGLKVGEEIKVKYFGRDPATGTMRLSRKALTIGAASSVKTLRDATSR